MKEETSNYQSIKYKGVFNFETEITAAEVVLPFDEKNPLVEIGHKKISF